MKRNCIFDDFTFWNAKDWACNSLPVNNCTPNYAWVRSAWFGQHRKDYTHHHYVFISLVILKNRTYLSRPSLGIFERDVYSLISLSLLQIKPSMSALECQCCSDWAVSWNLVGSISCAWCHWDTTEILISQLLKGRGSNASFHPNHWDLQQWHRPLFPLKMRRLLDHLRRIYAFL